MPITAVVDCAMNADDNRCDGLYCPAPIPARNVDLKESQLFPTNLRDTLLVLPSVECRPRDLTRVLALEEERLGLAILESENLAVTADIELALYNPSAYASIDVPAPPSSSVFAHFSWVDLLTTEGIVVGTHDGGFDAVLADLWVSMWVGRSSS